MSKVIRLKDETIEQIRKARGNLMLKYQEDLRFLKIIAELNENDIIQIALENYNERSKNEQKQ